MVRPAATDLGVSASPDAGHVQRHAGDVIGLRPIDDGLADIPWPPLYLARQSSHSRFSSAASRLRPISTKIDSAGGCPVPNCNSSH